MARKKEKSFIDFGKSATYGYALNVAQHWFKDERAIDPLVGVLTSALPTLYKIVEVKSGNKLPQERPSIFDNLFAPMLLFNVFPAMRKKYPNEFVSIGKQNKSTDFLMACGLHQFKKGNLDFGCMLVLAARDLEAGIATERLKLAPKLAARKAAKARHAKAEPLWEKAWELYAAGTFKSKRNAAQKIAPKLADMAEEFGIRLSSDRAPITIAEKLSKREKQINTDKHGLPNTTARKRVTPPRRR